MYSVGNGMAGTITIAESWISSLQVTISEYRDKLRGHSYLTKTFGVRPVFDNIDSDMTSAFTKTRIAMLETFDSLPTWFDRDEYLALYSRRMLKVVEDDNDLSTIFRIMTESTKPDKKDISINSLDAFEMLGKRLKSLIESVAIDDASKILETEFPESYFFSIQDSALLMSQDMDLLADKLQKAKANITQFSRSRGISVARRMLDEFKEEIAPIFPLGRAVSTAAARLEFYVKICNAENIEEILSPVRFEYSRVDKTKLERMIADLENENFKMRKEMVRQRYVFEPVELSEETKQLQANISELVVAQ